MTWQKHYKSTSYEYGPLNPAYQRIKDLKELMTTGDYAKKYKKGDKLDEKDIEDIAKSILQVFKDAYPQRKAPILGNDYKKLTKDEQENLALETVKKILNDVTFEDETYNNFVSLLTLNTGKSVPYSFQRGVYFSAPSILDYTMFYMTHPNLPIQLGTKIKTDEEIYDEMIEDLKTKKEELEKTLEGTDLTIKQKEKQIENLNEEIAKIEAEKEKALKGVKIAKEGFDYVVGGIGDIKDNSKAQNAALGELLKKNKSDILNDVALRLAGNPDLKKNIRKIKGDIKASNPNYSDGDINYIITKALSENDKYLKTVAANPDLFDRDMSNDTIQKENEQFQSKLRQQNLRYILPKFIERREKLVENTLNPELLKGAFAI